MRTYDLLARNLTWHWRTNLAALLGVAAAAGVLGGAILVGDSVRVSLRAVAIGRLGRVGTVSSRSGLPRKQHADAVAPVGPPARHTCVPIARGGARDRDGRGLVERSRSACLRRGSIRHRRSF